MIGAVDISSKPGIFPPASPSHGYFPEIDSLEDWCSPLPRPSFCPQVPSSADGARSGALCAPRDSLFAGPGRAAAGTDLLFICRRPAACLGISWGEREGVARQFLIVRAVRGTSVPLRLSVTVVFITCLCYLSESSWASWAHLGWDAVMQPVYQEVPGMGCAAAAAIPISLSLRSARQSIRMKN